MQQVPTDSIKSRTKSPSIDVIQPLSWEISAVPDELRCVYALRLPEHWLTILKSLGEVDRMYPLTSLYLSLRALAPEVLHIYLNAFSNTPSRRPSYWLLAQADTGTLNEERLLWAIHAWLHACYSSGEVRTVAQQLKATDLHWERVDLQQASPDIITGAVPGLVARWLIRAKFEFGLTNGSGQLATYPMRLAPSTGSDVDLVTWPPAALSRQHIEYSYSYYLKFRMATLPGSDMPRLLCHPGIRRWVSQPLAGVSKSGKNYVDLVWGREKGVFVSRKSASWLTQQPAETCLIRLGLRRYNELVWAGRLPEVLASLSPNELIPDPFHLLAHPTDFHPNILIIHDANMSEKHRVGAGIEEADRWEVFTRLTQAFPSEMQPTPTWMKGGDFHRMHPSFASKPRTQVPADIRLKGIANMPSPALIEICSSDADHWEQIVRDEIGAPVETYPSGHIEAVSRDGDVAILDIVKRTFPVDLSAQLPPEAADNDENQRGLTFARVREIEKQVPPVNTNTGVLQEMLNYQDLYHKDTRERRRDPKLAARWGLARVNRKLQCIQPESVDPDDYEDRVRSGVRDLLRQLGYCWNPLYTGFKGTSLPSKLDLLGLWQIRLKPRRHGENPVTFPLVIHTPGQACVSYVCLPGKFGPVWYHYADASLKIPDLIDGYPTKEAIRAFFTRAIGDRGLAGHALLLMSEQNVREVFPEVKDDLILAAHTSLRAVFSLGDLLCRIARLRFSGQGTVPLVCPTHTFGRYSGLFHDERFPLLFYSIQERPVSALRPTGLRQRDAQTKLSWNPSTVEIMMTNLQEGDEPEEWAWVVHRLRQESFHTDRATLLPEPLNALEKLEEYVPRIFDDGE